MGVQIVGPEVDACVSALHRAGLELREHVEEGNGTAFLLQGNTFANKELLKRHGGRWSRSAAGLGVRLARAHPRSGDGVAGEPASAPAGGLADAPAAFEPATPSFIKLRKRAQNSRPSQSPAGSASSRPVRRRCPTTSCWSSCCSSASTSRTPSRSPRSCWRATAASGGVLNAEPAQLAEFHDLRKTIRGDRRVSRLSRERAVSARRATPRTNGALSEEGSALARLRAGRREGRWEIVRLWRAARDRDPAQGDRRAAASGCCARRSGSGR